MLVRIQEKYESLLSDSTNRVSIGLHYGSRLFKCTYLFCPHSREGFATLDERNKHVKYHGQPYKCSLPSCDFSAFGFDSKKKRDDHWLNTHVLTAVDQIQASSNDFANLDPEEVQPLLFAFIIEGDNDGVRRLVSSSGGKKLKAEVVASARLMAANQGSLLITRLLAPSTERYLPVDIVKGAVTSEDFDFAAWAIPKAQTDDFPKLMNTILGVKSDEIYTLWEKNIRRLQLQPWQVEEPAHDNDEGPQNYADFPTLERMPSPEETFDPLDQLFKQALFTKIKGNLLKEARLRHTLSEFRGEFTSHELGTILVRIAKSSCSLSLAEETLRLGAHINFPQQHGRPEGMTALQSAAKKTTLEAAFFMRFLIRKGASTSARCKDGSIKDIGLEKGAQNISQHMGMTWDDLIKEYHKQKTAPG